MAIHTGFEVVFGVPKDIKPITGLPDGKVKMRLRNTTAGRVFVRTANGVEHYVLLDNGDTWGLMAQGVNKRL